MTKKREAVGVSDRFYKNNKDDVIWWVDNYELDGVMEFTFDKEKIYNLFQDYPHALTPEQKAIFDRENPFWVKFFGT